MVDTLYTTDENSLIEEFYKVKTGDEDYETRLKEAENHKTKGNSYVKENKLSEAIECFTNAINLKVETLNNAIYLSNRAFINLKLENYGSALEDANKAIEVNSTYIKAYYRRASAYLFLRKYDEALSDLKLLKTHFPSDNDIDMKIKNTIAERRKKKFLESIQSDHTVQAKDLFIKAYTKYNISNTYTGLVYESSYEVKKDDDLQETSLKSEISHDWIVDLMEKMKKNEFIHSKYLTKMIYDVKTIFDKENSLVDISYPSEIVFNVCGDIHGQYYDLMNIFKVNGYPSETNPYLFNGDFVDRGSYSVECVITLIAWKLLYPKSFYMSRGNHESKNLNKMYGFEGEVRSKYDDTIYELFCSLFCSLPLCHVLNKKVFVTHGGLFSKDDVSLDDLRRIDRKREPPETGLMCEILWSDPCKEIGRNPSKRGVGLSFGPDITKKFLDYNNLELIIRSHEVKQEGYEVEADGRLITVFSAPNYCDQMGNKGAIVKLKGENMKPTFFTFTHVEHPKVPAMKYASPWMMF